MKTTLSEQVSINSGMGEYQETHTYELQPWSFQDGVALVRTLEKKLACRGWHVALAGSVLHKGTSSKDLDVVAFPHDVSNHSLRALEEGLVEVGARRVRSAEQLRAYWRSHGSSDTKHVETWAIGDCASGVRRIDVLVLT